MTLSKINEHFPIPALYTRYPQWRQLKNVMRLPFNLIIDRGSKISSVMPPHSLLNAELQGPLLQVRKQFILFDNAGLSWGILQ